MTRVKLCGLTRMYNVETANLLLPEYIGFVFAEKSKRYINSREAAALKAHLRTNISAVGVFVDEEPGIIADLLSAGIIDVAQLHGHEDENYIKKLRTRTDKPIIKAFSVKTEQDVCLAQASTADFVLLDSEKGGTGTAFEWKLLSTFSRPFFLAGGLNPNNVRKAVEILHPFAVDVSSGIETDGCKDRKKMFEFVYAART